MRMQMEEADKLGRIEFYLNRIRIWSLNSISTKFDRRIQSKHSHKTMQLVTFRPGVGNNFCTRATLRIFMCLAGQIPVKKKANIKL